jgi:hypothetical protein
MAVTLQLTDGTTTIDFTNTTGFQLLRGYIPKFASPTGDGSIPPYVVEALPVYINATSDDNLAATMQGLHALQKRAAEYMVDPQQTTPVWFHRKLTAETGTVRYLVASLDFSAGERLGSMFDVTPAITEGRTGVLAIEHHPYGERTATRAFPQATPSAAASIMYDYTAAGSGVGAYDYAGDVGVRPALFEIGPAFGDGLARIWMGIRSAGRHGTVANFVPVWELEDGTNFTDVSDVVDATASGGNKVQVVESALEWDNTWQSVCSLALSAISANEADQYGEFLWLIRGKVTAGTWEVRLEFRLPGMLNGALTPPVEISNTSWDISELATHPIPYRNLHAIPTALLADSYDQSVTVEVQAQRTSGAGNLDLDCLLPVPIDEGYAILESLGGEVTNEVSAGNGDVIAVCISPEDGADVQAIGTTPSFNDQIEWMVHNFYFPPGDGRLIIAFAGYQNADITDTLEINYGDSGSYYERWVSLRGAE